MVAGAGFRLPVGSITLLPSSDVRVFRREDGRSQGYLIGLGTAIEMGPFVPSIRGRIGNLVVNDQFRTNLYGGEVGLALRLGR
jgi:hypothetical protein